MTATERKRMKDSEHSIYVWSRVLVALSLIGIVLVSLVIGILLYVLLNIDTFTSANFIQMPRFFPYLPKDAPSIKIDLAKDQLIQACVCGLLFACVALLQSLMAYLFVQPLFQEAFVKHEEEKKLASA